VNPARDGLYDHLVADATITSLLGDGTSGVYHRTAPRDATTPLVVFDRSAGTPTWTFTTVAAFEDDVWLVKAIARGGSATTAEDIAARIDLRLNNAQFAITGRTLQYCRRVAAIDYGEGDGADQYHHCGAIYRLVTVAA